MSFSKKINWYMTPSTQKWTKKVKFVEDRGMVRRDLICFVRCTIQVIRLLSDGAIGKKLFFGVFLNLCWHQQEMESIIIWNIFTHSPDPIGLIYQVSSHLTICSKFDKCFYATAFSFHFHFTTADVSKYISRINSIIVKTHSIRSSRYCKFLARFNRVQPLLPK